MLKRAIRFVLTGIFVTALHALIAIMFIRHVISAPPMANGVAFIAATIVSYIINTTWSFSARLHGRTLLRFASVSAAGFVLAIIISWLVQELGFSHLWGILAVALTVPLVTFVLHNFWTYKE